MLDTLFSPLSKEYCLYFYYLSVISFVFLFVALYHGIVLLIKGKTNFIQVIIGLLAPFLLYFNNRLLYSMCV